MSHPQIVEAIESEFVPVVVYNNQKGKDEETLKEFGEPAWNFQVIRFLTESGADVIPRRDRIWTVAGVAARMVEALEKVNREVPTYLKALAGSAAVDKEGVAAFAMFCFWTGEQKLGGLEGVLTTEAGWLEGREVTWVSFDRAHLSFGALVDAAAEFECAQKVYTNNSADAERVAQSRLSVGDLTDEYRAARVSDQKRQLTGTLYQKMNLSPVQATKLNALIRTDVKAALKWLSPHQREQLKQS